MLVISTCLIGQNVFIKEGLKSLLAGTSYEISATYQNFSIAQENGLNKNDHDLVIIFFEENYGSMESSIKSAKDIFSACPVVVLISEIESNSVIAAFSAGADGCLSHDVSPAVLIGTLNMVMAGEKVFPAAMLRNINSKETEINSYDLSAREMQILGYISAGKTNKQIANDLYISEATVKVHIKAVLRKLNFSNRTQAAVWAVNKGLTTQIQRLSSEKSA